jgi:hypothetical protein
MTLRAQWPSRRLFVSSFGIMRKARYRARRRRDGLMVAAVGNRIRSLSLRTDCAICQAHPTLLPRRVASELSTPTVPPQHYLLTPHFSALGGLSPRLSAGLPSRFPALIQKVPMMPLLPRPSSSCLFLWLRREAGFDPSPLLRFPLEQATCGPLLSAFSSRTNWCRASACGTVPRRCWSSAIGEYRHNLIMHQRARTQNEQGTEPDLVAAPERPPT